MLTAKIAEPTVVEPVKLESPFFKTNPFFTSSQKLLISGKKESLLLNANETYMSYEGF